MIFPNPLNLRFFIDTIDSLKNEFRNDTTNRVVVTGISDVSRKYDVAWFRKKYGGHIIAFNQEPLLATQRDFMHPLFFKFLKEADEVWDYDDRQVKLLQSINPKHICPYLLGLILHQLPMPIHNALRIPHIS